MGFLKKLFSSGNKGETGNEQPPQLKNIYTDKYFKERYIEQDIYDNPAVIDGCFKMIKSYFIDNKLTEKVPEPINHPFNLDQAVNDDIGFNMYCKAFNLPDSQIIMTLTLAFSDFLIKTYGFKAYRDAEPELPLRSMTLKYDKNGAVLSLYPFEYSLKVLQNESTFSELFNKLDGQLKAIPDFKELLKTDEFIESTKDLLNDIIEKNKDKNL